MDSTETFEVIADYRPRTDRSPKYYYRTDKGAAFVRAAFENTLTWLKVYQVRKLSEDEITDHIRKWALDI